MKCPILNPVRFYDSAALPNYSTRFPLIDNITQRTVYVPGVHPTMWYKEWIASQTMYLQFVLEGEETSFPDIVVYKFNESTHVYDAQITKLSGADISPGGWTTEAIGQYSWTPSAGTYYLQIEGYSDISDKVFVTNDSILTKMLIKIKYSNSENDYGCIFTNSEYFNQFFSGQLIIGDPQNEISAFQSDRGNLELLQATPVRVVNLIINDLHYTYVDHVNLIFSCDTITINGGATYQNSEPPTIERIGDSDLVNVTVKLLQTNNDYLYL